MLALVTLALVLVAALLWADPISRAVVATWTGTTDDAGPARTGEPSLPHVRVIAAEPPPSKSQIERAQASESDSLVIRAVDTDGQPYAGAVLLIWTQVKATNEATHSTTNLAKLTTNGDGFAVVPARSRLAEVRILNEENQQPLNDSWFAEKRLTAPIAAKCELILLRPIAVSIRIAYDDGEVFEGRAGAGRPGTGWMQWKPVTNGLLEVAVPEGGDVRISASIERPGYDRSAHLVLDAASIVRGGHYELIISKSNSPWARWRST